MREKKLTLTQKKLLDMIAEYAKALPAELKQLPVSTLVKLLRKRLHMTQADLAHRAKVPQSFISKIESGREKPKLATLEKLFSALFCDCVLIPIPIASFDEILNKQALKAARSRLEYVLGTMSLEKQLPGKEIADELVKTELERLLQSGSSEIWQE